MTRMLRKQRDLLEQAGLIFEQKRKVRRCAITGADLGEGTVKMHEASFVDDSVVPGAATDMVGKIAMVAQICERNCARFGVTLNWSKGKSEATITYRGPGASEARKK